MLNNSFFYFFTLSLFKEKKRYVAIILIFTTLIFLLSSVLFISASIKYSLNQTLKYQPDFVVQKVRGGILAPMDENKIDKILNIYGVEKVTKRVYGRYFFDDQKSALIVGVDFFDEQSNKMLELEAKKLDLKAFLSQPSMIVGKGVKSYLNSHYYPNYYTFLTPDGKFMKVKIFKTLNDTNALFGNDLIILPINLAQKILGLKENQITDIALNAPNESEWSNIKAKLQAISYDFRVVDKKDVAKIYENIFNYKGGLFLSLYLIVIVTFSLLLYLRYSLANSVEKREIATLRAVGWSIKDVLKLKFFENIFIVIFASVLGFVLAYIYVFILGAPLLKEIFLGGDNLKQFAKFVPVIDFGVISTLFIIFALTFLASVLIPVWRIAITEPKEALG